MTEGKKPMFTISTTASKNKDLLLVGILIALTFASLFIHNGQGPMVGNLDIAAFYVINQDMQCPTLDSLAATASQLGQWMFT